MSWLVEVVEGAAILVFVLCAGWFWLLARRYRRRWRSALRLGAAEPQAFEDGRWVVALHKRRNGQMLYVLTNGCDSFVATEAYLEYPGLGRQARETADRLAAELNNGSLRVS